MMCIHSTDLVGVDEADDFLQNRSGDIPDDNLTGRGLHHAGGHQGFEVVAAACHDGRVNLETLRGAVTLKIGSNSRSYELRYVASVT